MRRSPLLPAVLLTALLVPGAARADLLYEYERLAQRELVPAPLVFTDAPAVLQPLARRYEPLGSRRRSGYGMRLYNASAEAVIAYQGGTYRGLRGAVADARRSGARVTRTRVRGHTGRLVAGQRTRVLLWREDGRIHWLGTGTPGRVTLRGLRRTADGLERLGGAFAGSGGDPDLGTGAVLVTTERTVTAHVDWAAHCVAPDGFERSDRGGSLELTLAPTDGTSFRADVTEGGWSGSVSGRIRDDAVDLTVQATTTVDGATCDTGTVTFAARATRSR